MGVDADDTIDLFCQHGHAVVLPSDEDDRVVGVGLGEITAWQNCDESRRWAADKLLIKPTKVGQADAGTPADISAHKAARGRQFGCESSLTAIRPSRIT
ncbi:hypothetical protein [Actinoallomurus soli]|uniref:hypothetical protein n=1 Tax=Actinoallomurus soli TaxID=2952535 RepID=UPI002092CF06|nr:hypothetical protein [Actinoallomurus soli]MCO5972417.1 hypothetical protein [Actinoallomurus soli]